MPIPKLVALAPKDAINSGNSADAADHIVAVRKEQYGALAPSEITKTAPQDAIGSQAAFDAFPDQVDLSPGAEQAIGSQVPVSEAQVTMDAVAHGAARNVQ
jgi:hypothetical protein